MYRVSQKKDARFSKIKNIPDLLSDDNEGKLMRNIEFKYFSNRASFIVKPVSIHRCKQHLNSLLKSLSAPQNLSGKKS